MQTDCYETFIQNNLEISSITRKLSLEELGRGSIVAAILPSLSSPLNPRYYRVQHCSAVEPRPKKILEEN